MSEVTLLDNIGGRKMSEVKVHDIVIIGSGPGGMTAGIYGGRAELDTVILELSRWPDGFYYRNRKLSSHT